MKESLPLHDISFGRVMQELNESPKQRKQREKERKRRECEEKWDNAQRWTKNIGRKIVWAAITAAIYFLVDWLLSKYMS